MPRQKFTTQVADVHQLLEVADAVTARLPSLSYTPIANMRHQPFVSGAIVLLCARFEEFLQDSVTYAIDQHQNANPPILLSHLKLEQQAHLVAQNFSAAIQKRRYGQARPSSQRVSDVRLFSSYVHSDQIWSDFAIETGGNPGSDTVRDLMKVAGVENPWVEIQALYSANYVPPTIPGLTSRTSLDPAQQLNEIIESRNKAAHTGAHLTLSPADVRFYCDFMIQLSSWIYTALRDSVNALIASKQSAPPAWNAP